MSSFEKIYEIVAKIPKGKVLTYKKVAELSGVKNTFLPLTSILLSLLQGQRHQKNYQMAQMVMLVEERN